MNNISPLASVSPKAILGDNIEIGPFAFVDDDVEIGDGCKIFPHATVFRYVKMGKNCQIYPGAVVGAVPQDLKFEGEVTSVELGDNVTVRECATINRGTKASGKYVTKVGNDTLIMSYSHIAHDCVIGDHCILVSYVGLAGETVVDDWAIIGGGAKAHQFSKIGCHAATISSTLSRLLVKELSGNLWQLPTTSPFISYTHAVPNVTITTVASANACCIASIEARTAASASSLVGREKEP